MNVTPRRENTTVLRNGLLSWICCIYAFLSILIPQKFVNSFPSLRLRAFGASRGKLRGTWVSEVLMIASPSQSSDLLVVGCGVLGTSLCRQVLQTSGADSLIQSITAMTKTTTRHESIRLEVLPSVDEEDDESCNFSLTTQDEIMSAVAENQLNRFKYVVFCAPPSGFDDYASAVANAIETFWLGPSSGGAFIFTSSGGIYEGKEGETVTERSPTANPEANPRTGRLISAERSCLNNGGTVLRFAGLYTLERGPHSVWLKSGKKVKGRPDGIINMLHYDDAAGACIAAIKCTAEDQESTLGKIFLISDGKPTTRKDICESSLQNNFYRECKMPSFLGGDGDPLGKVYDGSWSNKVLKWKPRYASFGDFMTV